MKMATAAASQVRACVIGGWGLGKGRKGKFKENATLEAETARDGGGSGKKTLLTFFACCTCSISASRLAYFALFNEVS